MSEQKLRSLQEIQSEYQNLCTRAGHLQYNISTLSKDLELLNSSLRDLNLEAAKVHAAAKEAPVSDAVSESVEEAK